MPRKASWNTADKTTVIGFFVLVGFGLETTISSNIGSLPPTGGSETPGDVFTSTVLFAGCGSGACHHAMAAPAIPGDDNGSGNTKTGICSYHNPYHQGKGESTKHLAAHQEQDEHGKESQTAGQDGSRKSLIDGLVDYVRERFLAQQTIVFTNAIEDDDRVVHGITDQRKQRRDDRKG